MLDSPDVWKLLPVLSFTIAMFIYCSEHPQTQLYSPHHKSTRLPLDNFEADDVETYKQQSIFLKKSSFLDQAQKNLQRPTKECDEKQKCKPPNEIKDTVNAKLFDFIALCPQPI